MAIITMGGKAVLLANHAIQTMVLVEVAMYLC